MTFSFTILDENKLQFNISVPNHLSIQFYSASCNSSIALIPHSFGLLQLADLLSSVIGFTLPPNNPSVILIDKEGHLMTVKTDEDLRQVYYWHSFVKLHQTQQHQQPQTRQRWGRLPHHVTVWLCGGVALLAPRALQFDELTSACADILTRLGQTCAVAGANLAPELLTTMSNGQCQLCSENSVSSGMQTTIRSESAYASIRSSSSPCCCQFQFYSQAGGSAGSVQMPSQPASAAAACSAAAAEPGQSEEALAARQWCLDDFDFGQERNCLGFGQFGTVYMAMCKVTNKPVALKSIDLCALGNMGGNAGRLDEAEIERLMLELKLLADCRHDNIISYLCSFFEQSRGRLFICTEVMDAGSLDKLGIADDPVLGFVTVSVVNGLAYLWQRCIVHRDVKLANILACRSGRVKICDLGLAKEAAPAGQDAAAYVSTCLASSFCGSYEYMSPERVRAKRYGHRADVWGLGVALYELACGQRPFGGRGALLGQMLADIREARVPRMRADIAEALSAEFHAMYTACLQRKAKHRPSKLTIKSCPFYAKFANLSGSAAAELTEHFKAWLASALIRIGRR
ncbi:hypothetical protein BOX15_Mlig002771g3 [Macrostomum lignano]|uniref:mitogen-activated protein kinase kinase n=1 Tax=Macrostomum lignano TaxID=282301 RepID=A0A267DK07_9PLAT|nr:hypothetical protein BOX15_Mlig002771g3 [Macrostomum lignano]